MQSLCGLKRRDRGIELSLSQQLLTLFRQLGSGGLIARLLSLALRLRVCLLTVTLLFEAKTGSTQVTTAFFLDDVAVNAS